MILTPHRILLRSQEVKTKYIVGPWTPERDTEAFSELTPLSSNIKPFSDEGLCSQRYFGLVYCVRPVLIDLGQGKHHELVSNDNNNHGLWNDCGPGVERPMLTVGRTWELNGDLLC